MRPEFQSYQAIYPALFPGYGVSVSNPAAPQLKVCFGQRTFDAEGSELPGRYFSREIHWPGGSSGVTIGRGYDMGQRTRLQVQRELAYAGLDSSAADFLSLAAGLRGSAAERFVTEYRDSSPVISLDVQQALFEQITTPEIVSDVKRILQKSDVVDQYGEVQWEELPIPVRELLFDLRYRGDYRPENRVRLQPLLARKDYTELAKLMGDFQYWRRMGVPDSRAHERVAMLSGL